jgi:hypothetical protein
MQCMSCLWRLSDIVIHARGQVQHQGLPHNSCAPVVACTPVCCAAISAAFAVLGCLQGDILLHCTLLPVYARLNLASTVSTVKWHHLQPGGRWHLGGTEVI